SIENSALCYGLTAARNQCPEGQDIEIGDTAGQRCGPPIHCPCGSLTTESRKGSRQGGCPLTCGKGSGHVWVVSSPEVVVDLCGSHRRPSVLHGPDGSQTQQEVVAGDQRQIHGLSRSREKPVSRVAVRQWQLLSGQHDLVGERRCPQRRSGLRQPLCQIEGEANSAPGIEQQRLPGRDGRKPQFIGGVPQLGSDARIQPGRCLQGPKPDVGVEEKFHSRSAFISVSSITGATMSPKIC